jgi:hypothetical protein
METVDEIGDHLVWPNEDEETEGVLFEELEERLPDPLKMLPHVVFDMARETRL